MLAHLLRCILSKFYIKPQLRRPYGYATVGCILSKFYIKPQLQNVTTLANRVVSYRNSTSNHNSARRSRPAASLYLIEILHQTTTDGRAFAQQTQLYLIEILHQTTTKEVREESREVLYLIEILHQTTTSSASDLIRVELYLIEILHQTTTSPLVANLFSRCILSKFYIKPQRLHQHSYSAGSCILSKFYIKPQRR